MAIKTGVVNPGEKAFDLTILGSGNRTEVHPSRFWAKKRDVCPQGRFAEGERFCASRRLGLGPQCGFKLKENLKGLSFNGDPM